MIDLFNHFMPRKVFDRVRELVPHHPAMKAFPEVPTLWDVDERLRMREAWVVLWWVPRGHRPTLSEAVARLELLRAKGPTQEAFTFKRAFLPLDAAQPGAPFEFGDECPAT